MYDRRTRTAFVACAVLATVLAVTVGAKGREIPADDICHVATWPKIPAKCVDGGRHVRSVGLVADASQLVAQVETKSEPLAVTYSGKGDLLHRPEAPSVPTVTVETRGNGVSVLRRVQLQPQN